MGFTHTCILHKCTRIIQFTCHVYRANGRVLHLIAQFSHLANGKMQCNYCNALRLEKVMQSSMKSSRVFNQITQAVECSELLAGISLYGTQ